MVKAFIKPVVISIPPSIDNSYDLIGDDKREKFLLDIWRGTYRLSKVRYQTRARGVIVLVRLDIDGSPHTNPDGTKLNGTHIHLYREGYEAKWAFPLDPDEFRNPKDILQSFEDFCKYCNIKGNFVLQEELI